jgi:hypothetical protein
MTDVARGGGAAGGTSRLGSAAAGTLRAAAATFRLAALAGWRAPAIFALAVLPELAQHAAEIQLGMYDSKAAFRAAAEDPLRWFFAYPKIAGFVLAILLTARFWSAGSARQAVLIGPRTLLKLLFAIGLTIVAELPFKWLKAASGAAEIDMALTALSSAIQAGLIVYLVGTLIGDGANSLRTAFTRRWPSALLLVLLAALVFVPGQALHMGNHLAAFGQPPALVWALMLFDSVWVGFMACGIGSALFVAYRAGPTWRGWTVRPSLS